MNADASSSSPDRGALSGGVAPGDILAGKYRVEQVLGSGGMGVVVAAEHIELCERVAIKFLLDEAALDAELAERFLREARASVRIKSEHVVRVSDVGRLPSGAPYMVMEYLAGEDLSKRLERGPMPVDDAVDCIIQACEAMNVAHHAGIVHRDLKPANLFHTHRPDGSAIIKVLDFGISKVSSPRGQHLSLTHTQSVMGSPLYMSPEQMRSSKDVDRRTDIWSLGVILYELLAGDVPFFGETFPEVLLKVMTEPAPGLRARRPEVPEQLEVIVQRCLAKDPAERYPSVAALAVALAPFASMRTIGLQGRLERSLSGPAPPPASASSEGVAPPALGATRVELPSGAARLNSETSPVALPREEPEGRERLAAGTNTAWEEARDRIVPPRTNLWWVAAAVLSLSAAAALLVPRWLPSSAPERAELGASAPEEARIAPAAPPAPAPPPPAPQSPAPQNLAPETATAAAPVFENSDPVAPRGLPTSDSVAARDPGVAPAASSEGRNAGETPPAAKPPASRPAPPRRRTSQSSGPRRTTAPKPPPAPPAPTPPPPQGRPASRGLSIDFK